MKTEDVLEKADVLMSTKSKAIISGKKYKSYEESIASAGKRLYSDSETTTGCCKKIKIEPYIPPKKLLEHKPVVDTKKLLENIRQIVIEDYPEATNLLGDDSFKNTCKERKNVKTKVTGKIKSVKSLDNNSKFVKPKIVSEEMVNDNSVNDPTEALANEKVPLTDITSLGECSTQVTLSKNNIQEESVDPEKPTGIVSATDQPTGSGKVL
ncbi:unnamed protein product [Acanthoscelides obtectus]|uniref:Uncharacterized protein n=1 Tax=Acanthoscelides obtectus TaxID=200917 RepID=A0A9P0KGZ8_ACAOB|nr:unnamed protein product [Acanthoscelides obtectus]CAK1667508.1 hypothetical protein AOBTE_LOCUS25878 [Acanthoscelides obtectus]